MSYTGAIACTEIRLSRNKRVPASFLPDYEDKIPPLKDLTFQMTHQRSRDHLMNGNEESWSWGLPVLPYFISNGQFKPSRPAPDGTHQPHCDWNSQRFGVDQFADSTEISERRKLTTYVPGREFPIRSGNHEKICEVRVRRFCCDGCVVKAEKRLRNVPGVSSAQCNVEDQTIIIFGTADPEIILNTLGSIKYLDPKLL